MSTPFERNAGMKQFAAANSDNDTAEHTPMTTRSSSVRMESLFLSSRTRAHSRTA